MNADEVLTLQEIIFMGVFAFLLFVVPTFVVWATYQPKEVNRIDLSSLWTHHDRIDKFAIILMGTWWVHTCSMILWTLHGSVVTADYLVYMGWATPIIAKMFAPTTEPNGVRSAGALPSDTAKPVQSK